jgi:hypothetical protein
VKAIQEAFMQTFKDPDFVQDAERQKLDVSSPRSGEDLMHIIKSAYAVPDEIIERLRRLSAAEGQ